MPAVLPDVAEVRADMADYAVAVNRLDTFYGQVLDALDEAGHGGNTIVIVTTDHGIAFPHMKCNLTSHGTGVLLIIRGPEGSTFRGGQVIDGMVQHLDLFPTLCDVAGLDKPDWLLGGRSLVPVVEEGTAEALHHAVFAEVTYHAAYEPKRSVRTKRHLYIRHFDEEMTTPVLPNCDPSPSRNVLIDGGWGQSDVPREQLLDLVNDPSESKNIVGLPEMKPILEAHQALLAAWMKETSDPLLNGPVPVPPGGKVNARRGLQSTDAPEVFPEGGAAP